MYQNIKPSEPHITARAKTAHLKPLNNPLFCFYVFCNYELETENTKKSKLKVG